MLTRRGFLKRLGATAVFTAAAPLLANEIIKSAPTKPTSPIYIPAPHLDYVPRTIDTTPLPETLPHINNFSPDQFRYQESVRVLMLQDTYHAPLGGQLRSGSEIRVPVVTAGRWLDYGIAVPAPGQPEVTPNTARRSFEAAQRQQQISPAEIDAYRARLYREDPVWENYWNTRTPKYPTNPNVEQEYLAFVESDPATFWQPHPPAAVFADRLRLEAAAIKARRDQARKNASYEEYIDLATTNPVNGRDEDTA